MSDDAPAYGEAVMNAVSSNRSLSPAGLIFLSAAGQNIGSRFGAALSH
jgi:hypothetical protein